MKFACLIYRDETALAGLSESDRLAAIVAECSAASAWGDELKQAGQQIFCTGLQSVRTAKTVRNRNGKLTITDGPFAETREQLGGYYLIDANDLDEAIEIAARIPPASVGTIEIRPLKDMPGLPNRS